MSRTRRFNDKYQSNESTNKRGDHKRRIMAKGVRRTKPDLSRMGKALIEFAISEAEASAEQDKHATPRKRSIQ